MSMTYEVVSVRHPEHVTAQFLRREHAKEYARHRNEETGWRAWRARRIGEK